MARKPPPDWKIACRTLQGGTASFPASAVRFRPAVYGIALDGQGRVLLGQSVFHRRWELPGGAVEPWERLEEGLVREFAEETGVRPEVGEPVGFDAGFVAFFQHPFHSLRFFYRVSVPAGVAWVPQQGEVLALEWRAVESLSEDELVHGHLTFIRRVAAREGGS